MIALIITFPFLLIFLLTSAVFGNMSKLFGAPANKFMLTSLLVSPLLLGLFVYSLYFLVPGLNSLFYIIALIALVTLVVIISRDCLSITWKFILTLISRVKNTKLSFMSKVLIGAVLPIILLVGIRTIFWPPIWDDQVFYIEQAYTVGQTHEIKGFFENIVFTNDVLTYEDNTSIRPGLPMIYSLSSMLTKSLSINFTFAQIVVLYFFLLTLAIVFAVTKEIVKVNKNETGLTALFFSLTTFYFIDHSISGFKELIIISGVLLTLCIIKSWQKPKISDLILVGIILGLMSFVNYSGTLVTLFFLVILLFKIKDKFLSKALKVMLIFFVAVIFSGLEIFTLVGLAFPQKTTPQITQTDAGAMPETTNYDGLFAKMSTKGKDEFTGYDIKNTKDLYLKGKFQGLFQFQFYGFVFVLFWIMIVARFSSYMKNPFARLTLFFLGLYAFIFFDPFNLNHHPLIYVLTISHKYTVLLVPVVSVLLSLEWPWLASKINRINPRVILMILLSYIAIDFLWIKNHYEKILALLENVMPVHRNEGYYLRYLKLGDQIFIIFALLLCTIFIILLLKNKKSSQDLFSKYSISFLVFLFLLFYAPCLFFFNTNYGLAETFKYTFSDQNTKLSHLKEKYLFSSVAKLNSLPHKGKVLIVNLSPNLIRPYTSLKANNIVTKEILENQNNPTYQDFTKNNIEYVFAASDSKISGSEITDIPFLKLVYQGTGNNIYLVLTQN